MRTCQGFGFICVWNLINIRTSSDTAVISCWFKCRVCETHCVKIFEGKKFFSPQKLIWIISRRKPEVVLEIFLCLLCGFVCVVLLFFVVDVGFLFCFLSVVKVLWARKAWWCTLVGSRCWDLYCTEDRKSVVVCVWIEWSSPPVADALYCDGFGLYTFWVVCIILL